jgi:hypothetical protein
MPILSLTPMHEKLAIDSRNHERSHRVSYWTQAKILISTYVPLASEVGR